MKEQSFDNDVNSLTGMSNSNSGAPSAIDEQAPTDAFERSWDWDFEVRELGPDETAECKVTMGADDLANLTVDGEERLDSQRQGRPMARQVRSNYGWSFKRSISRHY